MYPPNMGAHAVPMLGASRTVRADDTGFLAALETQVSGKVAVPTVHLAAAIAGESSRRRVHVSAGD